MGYFGYIVVFMATFTLIDANYAPTGCTFRDDKTASCDYTSWEPPFADSDFGPGDMKHIEVTKVDGTIPDGAFGDLTTGDNSSNSELRFECDLTNIIVGNNVFTSNLDWIEILVFKSCYVQNGLPSGTLSNLTNLEDFEVKEGIIGPLASDTFSGLTKLKNVVINADFLDADLPAGLFTSNTNLETIDLASSSITSLPVDTFTGLESLTKLDLSDNALKTLPEGLFSSLISLTTVNLGTNDWNCTCDLAWLSTWALYTGTTIDVTCSTPSKYAGVSLGRAAAIMGCYDSVATTSTATDTGTGTGTAAASDTSSDGTSSTDDSTDTLTYVALGVAGGATVIAIATTIALICVCRRLNYLTSALERRFDFRLNQPQKKKRINTISTINERPPSYSATDRMFIQTPIQKTRETKIQPLMNVRYNRGMPSP